YHTTLGLIGTLPAKSDTTFTHVGAGANGGSKCYYIKTRAGCDAATVQTSVASVTLCSIYLTTSNTSTSTNPGIATLNWTAQPLLPTTTGNVYNTNSNYNAGGAWSSF